MAKCNKCGKQGLFLKTDNEYGLCLDCYSEMCFQREQVAYALALIKEAEKKKAFAENTNYLRAFVQYYDEMLSCLSKAAKIEGNTKDWNVRGNGSPSATLYRYTKEKQWHMRDAIEREYNLIVEESKEKYKNNKKGTLLSCESFIRSIKMNKESFDDETLELVHEFLKKLSLKFNVDISSELPMDYEENDFDSLNGYDFELWCANLLRKNGYKSVEITRGSGDQGVDIIAEKDGIRYAIQCKRYSTDIGNKPIQEVVAGKSYYKCQIGAVMTNRYFTKSAKELANATGTLLWDRDKIKQLLSAEEGKGAISSDGSSIAFGKHNKITPNRPYTMNKKGEINAEKKAFPRLKRVKEEAPSEDDPPAYNYPPIDLLAQGEVEDTSAHGQRDMQKAKLLEDTLQSFGISAKLTGIAHGPAVTRFELQPAPGVKVSRITSLSDDIALNLAAMSVRIEAPIPGKAAVGVEIPNDKVEMVRLRDVLESGEARKHPSRIAVGLGKDNSGRYIVADIAKMPHVLIAGQTGSGKSVCINAIIASILFRASPEEVKLILIDPKVVELSVYNNIPHLVCPVVTDPKKAASALDWAVAEMTKRYKLFAERGVRDIKGYNKSLKEGEKLMPQMVIIIDELADLMMVSPGEVEDSICRLAQLARACGMHLVIATQRLSAKILTSQIKDNISTRIAFLVKSQTESLTIIENAGAEKLMGNGDMLFVPNGMKSIRVQGAWVSDDEVHNIVEYIKQSGEAEYDPDMLEHMENVTRSDAEKEEFEAEYDNKLPEAVDIAIDLGQVSISMLQRKMRIGYARAGRIIDEMSRRGIVSEADGSKPREVIVTRKEALDILEDHY